MKIYKIPLMTFLGRFLPLIFAWFIVLIVFAANQEKDVGEFVVVGILLAMTYFFIKGTPLSYSITELGLEAHLLFKKNEFISSWDEITGLYTYRARGSHMPMAAIMDSFKGQTDVWIEKLIGEAEPGQFVKTIIERAELVHVKGFGKYSSS